MLLFIIESLLLFVPSDEMPMVDDPEPTPNNVVVLLFPTMLQFLMQLFVAGSAPPVVCNHTTALEVPELPFVMVRSWEAADGGQIVFAVDPLLPSMITLSAPLR